MVPSEVETLDGYTSVCGPTAEKRIWNGRGKVQEADLRIKHGEYLREIAAQVQSVASRGQCVTRGYMHDADECYSLLVS